MLIVHDDAIHAFASGQHCELRAHRKAGHGRTRKPSRPWWRRADQAWTQGADQPPATNIRRPRLNNRFPQRPAITSESERMFE